MKLYLAVAIAAACLAVSGVGFAWEGGGGCDDHHHDGCTSSPALVWESPTTTAATPSTTLCVATANGSTLSIAVGELVPGARCAVNATLKNVGRDSVALTAVLTSDLPAACALYGFTDDLVGLAQAPSLYGGHTFSYHAAIQLASGAGNSCMGTSASWSVSIGGSGGGGGCGGGGDEQIARA